MEKIKKVRVGVFGAGRGMSMVNELFQRTDACLVAVCDKYVPALDACAKKALEAGVTDIEYYTNFEDFIKHDMDAVVLANYANEHAPYAIRAMEAGKHVIPRRGSKLQNL